MHRRILRDALTLAALLSFHPATAAEENRAPSCEAGPARVVLSPHNATELVGSASDPDGVVVSWHWEQIGGPACTLRGEDGATLQVEGMREGLYRFRLGVQDDDGATASDEVVAICHDGSNDVEPAGDLQRGHRVALSFRGPERSETGEPNPFLDHRLELSFVHEDGRWMELPGFFAADGDAAESSATRGDVWRAHFAPPLVGVWTWHASFRSGEGVAVAERDAGEPSHFDGASGEFVVQASHSSGRDLRRQGTLRDVGERYLRFAATGERYLKGGANSPENLLAYVDFDGTPNASHHYRPHLGDFVDGETWKGGKGKGLLGAMSYLGAKGMNSAYFLSMNVGGDGDDVWPWIDRREFERFDCSKLDQWERVFSHMQRSGLVLHMVTQETENDRLLDGGRLGPMRKLYYRELVARFSHHPGLVWNLGEENTNSTADLLAFEAELRNLDPYGHAVVLHTYPGEKERRYQPLLEAGGLSGASMQVWEPEHAHQEVIDWVERAESAGRPWSVCVDEIGPGNIGVAPDGVAGDHDLVRARVLWGTLLAGGAGCEWYFGYAHPDSDLTCEDFRSRDRMWGLTDIALSFFPENDIPFWRMRSADHLTNRYWDFCAASPGESYVVLRHQGGAETTLDLQSFSGNFEVRWYDPRHGGGLQVGSVDSVEGPGPVGLGWPPAHADEDWVALVRARNTAPRVAVAAISPDPFDLPGDVVLAASVEDADGTEDVRAVQMYLWSPEGRFVGKLGLPARGDGQYRLEIDGVQNLMPGEWRYMVLALDRKGKFGTSEMRRWMVR